MVHVPLVYNKAKIHAFVAHLQVFITYEDGEIDQGFQKYVIGMGFFIHT